MNCMFCMYEKDGNECTLKGAISPEVRAKGCESFMDKPWGVSEVGGCCGMVGLPFADSEKLYDKANESAEEEVSFRCRKDQVNRGCPPTPTSPKIGG
jgi:hypothetical protein